MEDDGGCLVVRLGGSEQLKRLRGIAGIERYLGLDQRREDSLDKSIVWPTLGHLLRRLLRKIAFSGRGQSSCGIEFIVVVQRVRERGLGFSNGKRRIAQKCIHACFLVLGSYYAFFQLQTQGHLSNFPHHLSRLTRLPATSR